jgi:hypothetical protein
VEAARGILRTWLRGQDLNLEWWDDEYNETLPEREPAGPETEAQLDAQVRDG